MTNRLLSILFVLSLVGICFSYQSESQNQTQGDPGLSRSKPSAETVILKYAVQIPTPKETEVVVVFESGNFVVAKQNQIVTIPANEPFRTIVGERASFTFSEKGSTSGNNFWIVSLR